MKIPGSTPTAAWVAVIGAGTLWGVGAWVADRVMARGVSPEVFALARFALGVPLLWWWHLRITADVAPRAALAPRERLVVVGTGVAMALNVLSWFKGIALIGPALPTVISICGAPVLVAMASVLLGYERADRRLLAALAMAVAGVWAVAAPGHAADDPGGDAAVLLAGIAWSVGSACCYALVVLGNARMPARLPAVSASAWGMAVATAVMALVAVPQGLSVPWDAAVVAGLAYTGIATTSVAYLAFAWGARRLAPTAAVVGTLVEPVVAVALAAWLLAQPLGAAQAVGAMLLAGSMGVLARRR